MPPNVGELDTGTSDSLHSAASSSAAFRSSGNPDFRRVSATTGRCRSRTGEGDRKSARREATDLFQVRRRKGEADRKFEAKRFDPGPGD
ncbi:MAG: hypothetical protein O3C21_04690 [Verrucomicrobia bacterium]|nr:hypothetical protein [Verrucomicrobiota bacterium]